MSAVPEWLAFSADQHHMLPGLLLGPGVAGRGGGSDHLSSAGHAVPCHDRRGAAPGSSPGTDVDAAGQGRHPAACSIDPAELIRQSVIRLSDPITDHTFEVRFLVPGCAFTFGWKNWS
jgi:hypothetical protein